MTLTAAQTTQFFIAGTQMDLSHDQRAALAAQGLNSLDDFSDFGKDELDQALKNMRTSIPPIQYVAEQRNIAGDVIAPAIQAEPGTRAMIMPAKSAHRLEVASIAWQYYTDTARSVTSINMHYNNVLKNFHLEWKAIMSMSTGSKPDVPCITKSNPPLRWTDTFMDYCLNTFGVRKTPLAYVIRDKVEVQLEVRPAGDTTSIVDPLIQGCSYGHGGSVLNDLIARLSHNHPLFKTDNAKVYSALEEATRSTAYSSTVKAFSRRRDGRSAWQAIVSSHAGSDKWELLQKENNLWLLNTKWNGRTYSLEKFCNQHRTRYVNLEEAKNHVDFQLPTEHTRVGYLLDNIENADADLRAALANVRQNVNGTRTDFEAAIAVMLPVDPYLKQRKSSGTKTGANISSVGNVGKADNASAGVGTSGVALRFHTSAEYGTLTAAQKDELYKWRNSSDGKKHTADERKKRKSSADNPPGHAKSMKAAIKAAVAADRKKQKQDSADVEAIAQILADAGQTSPANPALANASSTTAVSEENRARAMKLLQIKRRASGESDGK